MKINWDLLPMKAHYFLFFGGAAAIMPFLPVYAKELGISQMGIAMIYTILPVTGMLMKPLFGAIVDHFQAQKLFFLACILITGTCLSSVQFIQEMPHEYSVELQCGVKTFLKTCREFDKCLVSKLKPEGSNEFIACQMICDVSNQVHDVSQMCKAWEMPEMCQTLERSKNKLKIFQADLKIHGITEKDGCVLFPVHSVALQGKTVEDPACESLSVSPKCEVRCNSPVMMDFLRQPAASDSQQKYYHTYQFWAYFSLLLLSSIGFSLANTVGDVICFQLLGPKHSDYGLQRAFGTVGFGLFSSLSGYMISQATGTVTTKYNIGFNIFFQLLFLDFIVITRLKMKPPGKKPSNLMTDVVKLLTKLPVLIFLTVVVIVGMCCSVVWQFQFMYLEELGKRQGCEVAESIKLLQGMVVGVQCLLGELPFMFLSGWVLQKIGHVNALTLVLAAFGLRLTFYSMLSDPWNILPIEMLQGITSGIFFVAMVSYASLIAPATVATTMQGIVGAAFEGLGISSGSFFGGVLITKFGAANTYYIFGICTLISCLIHAVVQFFLQRPFSTEKAMEKEKLK